MSRDTLIRTNDGVEFRLSEVEKIECNKTNCKVIFKDTEKSTCAVGLSEAEYYNKHYNIRIELTL